MNTEKYKTNPDGSISWVGHASPKGKRKIIAHALYEAQKRMPAGQMWSLYSWAVCVQLAEKVARKLEEK